jgi:hypothetical protein
VDVDVAAEFEADFFHRALVFEAEFLVDVNACVAAVGHAGEQSVKAKPLCLGDGFLFQLSSDAEASAGLLDVKRCFGGAVVGGSDGPRIEACPADDFVSPSSSTSATRTGNRSLCVSNQAW